MQITLEPEELTLLLELLEQRRDAMIREISRTDSRDFRTMLRQREQLLEGLLERLRTRCAAEQAA